MTEREQKALRELIEIQQDDIRELRASQIALLKVIKAITPLVKPEIRAEIIRYHSHRKEIMEKLLLILEKRNPARAAMLDKKRPLISPDEEA